MGPRRRHDAEWPLSPSRDGPNSDNDESTSRDFQAAVEDLFPPPAPNHPPSHPRNPSSSNFQRPNEDQPAPSSEARLRSRSRRRNDDDPSDHFELQAIPPKSAPPPAIVDTPVPLADLPYAIERQPTDKISIQQASEVKDTSIRDEVKAYILNKKARKNKKAKNRIRQNTWKDRAGNLYQKVVIETILRRKPLPPSKDGRHIPLDACHQDPAHLLDERSGKPYISNFIRSSRYTVYDFVPKQLIFQFSKLGNFYFLVMGILQLIPGLSTVGRWTTIAPLGVFVAFSMAKEGYDDYRRYRLDRLENRSQAWVLVDEMKDGTIKHAKKTTRQKTEREKEHNNGEEHMLDDLEAAAVDTTNKPNAEDWVMVKWERIRVGDIIRLRRDEAVPADIILLSATGPNGIAYIETMALDGETNLKSKQASPLLAERCNSLDGLRATRATIVSEDPNLDLYSYDGRATVDGDTMPLSLNNVVYRGSTLRNTKEAIGIVVNSGEECKIRMNANKNIRAKKPAMQSIINMMIIVQIVIVLSLAVGLTIGYHLWTEHFDESIFWIAVSYKNIFFGYLIMFNTLIPLSLYISLEIVKLGQLVLLQDVEMYDPVTDTPMVANTTTILENLGQVSYVFSDKTGTLTENIMRFRKLSVAGVACLHDMDVQRDEDRKLKRIQASSKFAKGKTKEKSRPSNVSTIESADGHDYESTQSITEHRPRLAPIRTSSVSSTSQWKSHARPDQDVEMKTEQLLDYIRRKPNTIFSRKAKHFLLCIALCHTCLPEIKDNGNIDYQASSPDELALVEAARDLGLVLIDRPTQSIKLRTMGEDGNLRFETYQILDVIEFSSKRKRMSIIIRMPDGRICVLCKGADNVIMSRLKLSDLAERKAQDIGRRASVRRMSEQDKVIKHMSAQAARDHESPRNSFALRKSGTFSRRESVRFSLGKGSMERSRLSASHFITSPRSPRASHDVSWSPRHSTDLLNPITPRPILGHLPSFDETETDQMIDESVAANEGAVFEKCFQHIDDFATEGLRTLLYAYRYIDEESYAQWKEVYREAETSLDDRQERIEEAGDLIEQKFDLAGATAIEDKLQDGVPDTIDKLRRANIKVWMLTGDKRETAVNIAHSARVCKPYSEVYILDATLGNLRDSITTTLNDVGRGMIPHSVVVIDGQTLAAVDNDADLAVLFYDLVVRVDSVICCRASPSQKANLVKSIRRYVPKSMTLAIGDGANDIGMIQASHVGIGISGREGLQASRISDYSIAQFRFLQRLLFVHGRWNYLRTGKYVLATFWKEVLFFLVQAHFQVQSGYTGISLYESWSLTVFNSAFTSLPVILLGIFDKDLSAETLLAVPELYMFGQLGKGFSYLQYLGWLIMGIAGSFVIWYFTLCVYRDALFDDDTSLFAMGTVSFTVAVVFINVKLLILELHSKTVITFAGLLISVGGWFMWMLALSGVYPLKFGPYIVRDAFIHNFGHTLSWWTIVFLELATLVVMELVVQAVRRVYWPTDQDLMQRIEKKNEVHGLFEEDQVDVDNIENGQRKVEHHEDDDVDEDRHRPDFGVRRSSDGMARGPYSPRTTFQESRKQRASHDDYRPSFAPMEEERENPEMVGRAF
ncbi:hypothetical protein BGZ63DRAFT_424547 [Mariannaea sp. PMI_226]|nr:hypothetical protein BGZ63DRAFT_424547 [Mariannaea sp. PMI_226]